MQERKTYRRMKKNKIYTIFKKKIVIFANHIHPFIFNVILLFFWGGK